MAWLQRLERIRTGELLRLVEHRQINADHAQAALELAGCVPGPRGWRLALRNLLAGLALALFAAGVACVVAYNWQAFDRWGRFMLAQCLVAGVFGLAWWQGLGRPAGKLLLTLAIALLGPLLALFGQTYQTGADTFELFRGWALLALPWTLAACFGPAWLLWLGIVQVGVLVALNVLDLWLVLWWGIAPSWLLPGLFNLALLGVWELAGRRFDWLAGRFAPRLLAAISLSVFTVFTCLAFFDLYTMLPQLGLAPLVWAATIATGYWFYRVRAIELGMLTLGLLSVTAVLMAGLVKLLVATHSEVLGLFLGAGLLIAASAMGRAWLARVGAEAGGGQAAITVPPDR